MEEIDNIIARIESSEKNWKALHMAVWGYPREYLLPMKETGEWETEIKFGLPASRERYQAYTPKELYEILTSKDIEITLSHLETFFSLFEDLIKKIMDQYLPELNIAIWRFKNIEDFLRSRNSFEKFSFPINDVEINELRLAKETRNCYIHNNSEVTEKWIAAYKQARGSEPEYAIGDPFKLMFDDIETWNRLIVNLSRTIHRNLE